MSGASLRGRKQSPEHVLAASSARRGWVPSAETRRRISEARRGFVVPRASCVACRMVLATNTLSRHRCRVGRTQWFTHQVFIEHNGPGPWPCDECPELVVVLGLRRGEGHVHHVDHDETNDDPANLVALHTACHHSRHVREGRRTCEDCGREWGLGWLTRHKREGKCT